MATEASGMNGRGPDGRFGPGNRAAAGVRQAHLQRLRKAFTDCVTVDDVCEVVGALLEQAKAGDMAAVKILFDRLFGRVQAELPDGDGDDTQTVRRDMFAGLSGEALEQARERERAIRRSRMSLEEQKAELIEEIKQWESKRHDRQQD